MGVGRHTGYHLKALDERNEGQVLTREGHEKKNFESHAREVMNTREEATRDNHRAPPTDTFGWSAPQACHADAARIAHRGQVAHSHRQPDYARPMVCRLAFGLCSLAWN